MRQLLFLAAFFLVSSALGQTTSFLRTDYSSDSGFPTTVPKSVMTDSLGYVWVASDYWLFRFDGKNSTRFFNGATNSQYIKSFHKDADGGLWVVDDLGITKIHSLPDTCFFERVVAGSYQETDSTVTTPKNLLIDSRQQLWIGNTTGLVKIKEGKQQKIVFPESAFAHNFDLRYQNSIFLWEAEKKIWAISTGGWLFCSDLQTASANIKIIAQYPELKLVTGWCMVKADQYAISSSEGLFLLSIENGKSNLKKLAAEKRLSAVVSHQQEQLIFSNYEGHLFSGSFSKAGDFEYAQQETFNWINNLYASGSSVWVCTNDGLSQLKTQVFTEAPSLGSSSAAPATIEYFAFSESAEGKNFIATENTVYELPVSLKVEDAKKLFHLPAGSIRMMKASTTGIWLEDLNCHIHFFDFRKKELRKVYDNPFNQDNWVNHLLPDEKGHLWVTNRWSGLLKISPDFRIEPLKEKLSISTEILCTALADNGFLYLGSKTVESYLGVYHTETGQTENLSPPLPESFRKANFEVTDLAIGKDGILWMATPHGLLKWDTSKKKQPAEKVDIGAFTNDPIRALTIDKFGVVYAANLFKVIRLQDEDISVFDKNSGIGTRKVAFRSLLADSENRIWIGSKKGNLVSIPFEQFQPPTATPEINHLSLNGQPVSTDTEAFHFPHLSYLKGQILAPFFPKELAIYSISLFSQKDTIRTISKSPEWIFPGLESGNYTLEVKVKESGQARSWSKPKTIRFSVGKAWYLNVGYWLLLLAGVGILVVVVVKVNTYRLKQDRKRLEREVNLRTQQIKEQNAELAMQKEEISSQADQLKEQNQRLLELDKFKQKMTSMIVHDLKNPLNIVLNLSDEEIVKRSGQQMLNMVMNMLDLQKSEEASLTLEKKLVSMDHLVEQAMEEMAFHADSKQIKLIKHPFQPDPVPADAEMIRRVLVNLIGNAIKYSPVQTQVEVGQTALLKGSHISEGEYCFLVKDQGYGVPTEKLESIFERFTQYQIPKAENLTSTGLGLAFCKMAIEAHGGKIWAERNLENGSTFYFTLLK